MGTFISRLLQSFNAIPILMYHRVADSAPGEADGLCVSPAAFARQMESLHKRGVETVTMEAYRSKMRGPLGRGGRQVAITFDDGYLDNYANAFPVLARLGMSATIFLATGRVGGRSDWQGGGDKALLTWDMAREMSDGGISFQSHTHTHCDLTRCDEAQTTEELERSRKTLEDALGASVEHLAYPYGAYDDRVAARTRQAGYATACAAGMSEGGAWALPRIAMGARTGPARFALASRPWAETLRRLKCPLD